MRHGFLSSQATPRPQILKKPNSSTPRRTGQDVLAELVTGFQRLVLSRDVDLGQKIGLGGYADVYEGELKIECTGERKKVALKCFRFMVSKEKEFAQVRRALTDDCKSFILIAVAASRCLRESCVYGLGLTMRTCCR
jgi:RIO-like serine/threonine protein kinase